MPASAGSWSARPLCAIALVRIPSFYPTAILDPLTVFLVICNQRLGNGLSDGIYLGSLTTTADADTDVDIGELVQAEDQERLIELESEDLRLDKGDWLSVNLDESLTSLKYPVSLSILL